MTATSSPTSEYLTTPNRVISAANGIDYAYRQVGDGTPALVLLQHFRGNLDNWDPALVDALARDRRVVTFDNAGVGGSTGTTPSTIAQMARDAIAFLEALELGAVDLLGFSIGSFVAQEIALIRPAVVRRLVLASAAPRGAAGMHGWAPEVIGAVGEPEPNPDGYLGVFFTRSAASRQAGVETLGRLTARRDDRDKPTTWQTRQAQYDAVCDWGLPDHGQLQRVSAIDMPVFVANGDAGELHPLPPQVRRLLTEHRMKHRLRSRLMVLSMTAAGALPQAALAQLPLGDVLGDRELAEQRGGFVTPQGLSLNFSMENVVLVNGQLQAHTVFQLAGQGQGNTPAALVALGPADAAGSGTTVLTSGMQTIIQNSLDQQNIQSIKVLNLELSNVRALQSLGLSNRIQMGVLDSLR